MTRPTAASRIERLEASGRARPSYGLSLVDNSFWPPRSPETEDLAPLPAMGSRPDSQRGPLTIIKIITLIVSMFAVSAAYYFWVEGWVPILNPPHERASFVSNSIVPPPPSRTSARDDDPGTPAKGEPRTARSFAGETVATLQPGTPGAQDPPSSTPVRPLDPEQIKLLMKQGEQFIAAGDMVMARLAFALPRADLLIPRSLTWRGYAADRRPCP
jgi:hypothetical protein